MSEAAVAAVKACVQLGGAAARLQLLMRSVTATLDTRVQELEQWKEILAEEVKTNLAEKMRSCAESGRSLDKQLQEISQQERRLGEGSHSVLKEVAVVLLMKDSCQRACPEISEYKKALSELLLEACRVHERCSELTKTTAAQQQQPLNKLKCVTGDLLAMIAGRTVASASIPAAAALTCTVYNRLEEVSNLSSDFNAATQAVVQSTQNREQLRMLERDSAEKEKVHSHMLKMIWQSRRECHTLLVEQRRLEGWDAAGASSHSDAHCTVG